MRSGREPLLPALAGFLVGVFFTLAVIQFEATFQMGKATTTASSPSPLAHWTGNAERYTMLTILLTLAVTAIVAYLRLARDASTTTLEKSIEGAVKENSPPRTVLGPGRPSTSPLPREAQHRDQTETNRGGSREKEKPRPQPSAPNGTRQPTPLLTRETREASSQFPVTDYGQSISPTSTSSYSDGLVEVWDNYYRKGDGRFNVKGLQRHLEEARISAEVLGGDQIGAGENLLIVDFRDGGPLHILPNFSKPTRALETWFQTLGSGARTALIQRLVRPATARRRGGQIVLENRGEVE